MNPRDNILQELKELGSPLATFPHKEAYAVPAGYFENLAENMLRSIKEIEDSQPSPLPENIKTDHTFTVPFGYFDGLEEKIMAGIRKHPDYLNPREELESLSPLLAGLQKKTPYVVPEGYFDHTTEKIRHGIKKEPGTKVISITKSRWYKMAVAAVMIGFFAISGIVYLNQNKTDVNKNPERWIAKNIKKVSTQEIERFINNTDPDFSKEEMALSKPVKTEYVKTLLKDVSDSEIEDFLDEAAFDNGDDDILMN